MVFQSLIYRNELFLSVSFSTKEWDCNRVFNQESQMLTKKEKIGKEQIDVSQICLMMLFIL